MAVVDLVGARPHLAGEGRRRRPDGGGRKFGGSDVVGGGAVGGSNGRGAAHVGLCGGTD